MSAGAEDGTPRAVELMVIGAGPAGLAAAESAAALGVEVMLIDEQPRPGGQIFRRRSTGAAPKLPRYAARLGGVYDDPSGAGISYMSAHCVWGVAADGTVFVAGTRGTQAYLPRTLVLATGAYEWVLPTQGWTVPGVISAGGAQALLKTAGVVAGRRVALGGCGPLLLQVATQMLKAGAEVAAVFDVASREEHVRAATRILAHPPTALHGLRLLATLKRHRVPIHRGWVISEIHGEDCVEGVTAAPLGTRGLRFDKGLKVEVDAVCLSFGLVPAVEFAALRGCALQFDRPLGVWCVKRDEVTETSIEGVFAVGDGAAIGGARRAVLEGTLAGVSAARRVGRISADRAKQMQRPMLRAVSRLGPIRSYNEVVCAHRPGLLGQVNDATIVCRCESVDARTVRKALADGAQSLHELRTRCRVGMGNCQGRMCMPTASRMLSQERNFDLERIEFPRQRPPLRPLNLQELRLAD
jgi:NADPH-dependent 2,4-dienoyl-CoA reductase/sulfur reductase-like enzyme